MNHQKQAFKRLRLGHSRSAQSGVTLIEVLVTVVILSIGLLGIAALHLSSLRNSTDSVSRSKATWLANDIIDRMRANRLNASTYVIGLGVTAAGASRADLDLIAWKNLLAASTTNNAGLTQGDGSVQQNGDVFTITISWLERNSTLSFVTRTEI